MEAIVCTSRDTRSEVPSNDLSIMKSSNVRLRIGLKRISFSRSIIAGVGKVFTVSGREESFVEDFPLVWLA
jgi:hypothetical protein